MTWTGRLFSHHRFFLLESFLVGMALLQGAWMIASRGSFALPGVYVLVGGLMSSWMWGILFLVAGIYYYIGLWKRLPWVCLHASVPLFFGWASFAFDFVLHNRGLLGTPIFGWLAFGMLCCFIRLRIVVQRKNHPSADGDLQWTP